MAVVQISRVQVRRGRKNTGTSVPQLASGELGWAVDTQELYIGNGSVAEGAPYVGNTKIITEHDNIFDLVGQYIYRRNDDDFIQTGFSFTTPIARSLQDRLDDIVSVRAFGVGNDSELDQSPEERTAAFQRAIDNLFLNTDTVGDADISISSRSRVILYVEPGVYTLSEALRIPPHATIVGAGKDKTIIKQEGDSPVIRTVGVKLAGDGRGDYFDFNSEDPSNPRVEPIYINLSGMTLEHTKLTYPVFEMNSVKNSIFKDLKFKSDWNNLDQLSPSNIGVKLTAWNTIYTCESNVFKDCEFTNLSYGVKSNFDIVSNVFENCLFQGLGRGVDLGECPIPQSTGPRNTRIAFSRFNNIDQEGIFVDTGIGNLSENNSFEVVGGNTNLEATYPAIKFQTSGNISSGDYFQRSVDFSKYDLANEPVIAGTNYIGEYAGHQRGEHRYNTTLAPVYTNTTPAILFRLPGYDNLRYRVHYLYKSDTAGLNNTKMIRNGTLDITVDRLSSVVRLTDQYDVTGGSTDFATAGINSENLTFTAEFDPSLADTVNVKYVNLNLGDVPCVPGDPGCNPICSCSFSYWYEVIS